MSAEKTESEPLGAVLMNGVGAAAGRESPGMGVSGSKPLVNGELREAAGDGSGDGEFAAVKTSADSSASSAHEEVAVKQSSSVSLIVSGGSTKAQASSTSKPRPSVYHSRPQQHRAPQVGYYRYVLPASHQPLYYPAQTYIGGGLVQGGGVASQLSSTNLYIRGLSERCCDEDLIKMCQQYGKIVSTKAILDKETNCCKGYGFVDFESPTDAMRAVQCLQTAGVMAQFAKQQEQDPTNLYFSNLPKSFDEKDLEALVSPYGTIVSTRILRDHNNISRGVGFVRLDSKESCDKTIEMLSGSSLPETSEPLMVKFADSSSNRKRQQTAGRWRDIGEYVYDTTHMLSQNGLVSSRVMQQGMLTSPYVQTPSHPMSAYQVPVSQTLSTGAWQPTYYVQPNTQPALAATTSVEGVASHLNHLHISTTSPFTGAAHQPTGYTAAAQTGTASYQLAPHAQAATQYTQQTHTGWNFHTHLPPQDHVPEVHTGAGEGKGHIQVIAAPDHTSSLGKDDQHSIHLYYPNTWVGK